MRSRLLSMSVTAAVVGAGIVAMGGGAASAVTNYNSSRLYVDQVFYAYVGADESLDVEFGQTSGTSADVEITVTDPAGDVALACTVPGGSANGVACADDGLTSTTAGAWKIEFAPGDDGSAYTYDIVVRDASDAVVTGRTWTTRYDQYQSSASIQSYWVATREGYLYGLQFINYNGLGSTIRANGFGLVDEGTCTPIYRSAEGTAINANGIPLEAGVDYSTTCGDDYLLFLEEPAADLPASAPSVDGELWVRPEVVPPTATDLQFTATDPLSRAGEITFDLAGVNGGYSIQIDVNADGDYSDAVDRIIPWGSPPGAVTVPFDGLDGLGNAIGVCQAMNARVVVDRVGETHFVLEDVEQLGNAAATAAGIRLTGLTPDITAPAPLLYWDDTSLAPRQAGEPYDGADGTAGFDTTTLSAGDGAHGWRFNWGNTRSIENWTYYQASAGAEVAVEAPCAPGMTIDKQATLDDVNGNGFADAGETIGYTFLVSNTGNTDLLGVTVNDPLVSGIAPATADIPAGMTQLFTAEPYEVTQADVDAGQITNSAVAEGEDPTGGEVETPPDTTITPGPERDPALSIEKTATPGDEVTDDDIAELGETVGYSFLVTNTGNVTLTGVTVDDSRVSGISPAPVTLVPGASQVFTADPYDVTQDDLNTGSITNIATATGTSPLGDVESLPDETTTPTPVPDPLLELDKSGVLLTDADSDGQLSVGDTVHYTFEVTNTGNVDLTGVTIDDSRLTGPTTPASANILANGSATFEADYVVQQADIDAGELRNTATASGVYAGPDGDVTVRSDPDTVVLETEERDPGLEIEKSASLDDANTNGFADVGETITYSFLVTNTGNTTLVGVRVIDEKVSGLAPLAGPLAPEGTAVITSEPYTVTQADVDAGGVANVAVARGNVPGGPEVTSPPDEEFVEGPPPLPGLELEKSALLDDANDNGIADAGETIVYSFAVTNTGNVTLTDVAVDDDTLAALLPAPLALLAPGVTVVVDAQPYTVTTADVAAGSIVNVATATGTPPASDDPVSSEEDSVTLITSDSDLASTGSQPVVAGLVALLALMAGAGILAVRGRRRGEAVFR